MGRSISALAIVVALCLAMLAVPVSASASSGEFTRAEANADWTLGSIAGSADWSGCLYAYPGGGYTYPGGEYWLEPQPEDCRLQAFVTVGPGSDPSECSDLDRHWPRSDENLTLVWESAETPYWSSSLFDAAEVPLSGAPDQLACLSLVESYWEQPYCPLGAVCPLYIEVVDNYSVLASTFLTSSPASSRPVNTEPPQLTGTPKVGETLVCLSGRWEGAESFTRSWLRDGEPITGKTGVGYVVQSADQEHSISCEVTATNSAGSTSATSDSLAVPDSRPVVEGESVSGVTPINATLEATIDPNGLETEYTFYLAERCLPPEPGIVPCLSSAVISLPLGRIPAGNGGVSVRQAANESGGVLRPGMGYRYWVEATNAGGSTVGKERGFTTAPLEGPEPPRGPEPSEEPESEPPVEPTDGVTPGMGSDGSQPAAGGGPGASAPSPGTPSLGRHRHRKPRRCSRGMRRQSNGGSRGRRHVCRVHHRARAGHG